MKIYFTLLFLCTTIVSSQNYNYALEGPTANNKDVNQNLIEEIMYFDSYLLPVSRSNELQEALNTHISVRLEKGDYSGTPIVMTSGQRLFGYPSINNVPNITIKEGSKNIRIQNVDSNIIFAAGSPITSCVIKNVKFTPLSCTNCQLEDNEFINLDRCVLNWDSSNSGYFRNNRFIRHWIHGYWPQIIMKGNLITPSYGNVTVWTNLLAPGGHSVELYNLRSHTFVGLDAESWNWDNDSEKAMLYMRDIGEINLAGLTGGNNIAYKTPVFDIEASQLNILDRATTSKGGGPSIVRKNTNVFSILDKTEGYVMEDASSGLNFNAYTNGDDVFYNQSTISNLIPNGKSEKLESTILGMQHTPWERGQFEDIPNTAGDNWKEDRLNKADQSTYIQNLIDSNNIAELDEGIYYIGKTLTIKDEQGIIGKGTGKTAIIGLSDDFPLITGEGNTTGVNFTLANLTLQGGRIGLRIHHTSDTFLQVTSCVFNFLVFRNQEIGIHLDKFYGFDNNFLDHLNFINCGIGLYQEVDPTYAGGETDTMMYVDKTVFYQNQFINCGTAISMRAERADNLIAWVNCNFQGNRIAADLKYHNGSFFANCDFSKHTGDYIIGGSPIGLFSNKFNENTSNHILDIREVVIEGCSFLDNVNLFSVENSKKAFIVNSKINADLGRLDNGMLINTTVGNNITQQPLLINFSGGIPITILDSTANPYPQLLVKY